MYSAVFMVTYADDVQDSTTEDLLSRVRKAADAISEVNLVEPTLAPPMPGGDMICELGFEDKDGYLQAKASDSWPDLLDILSDTSLVSHYEFVAYGDGAFVFQEGMASKCHRILIFSLIDDADPDTVKEMEGRMVSIAEHVPGLLNCKFAPVDEASGSSEWAYAFECDFDEAGSFLGKYMTTPYHFCFIDKYFEPACNEWVVDPGLCTPYCAQETPFLANYVKNG